MLVSSLRCHVGDAPWNELYTGMEYLQYRHIDLILDGGEAQWENLCARITLEYCKGHKDERNAASEEYLHLLTNQLFNICAR